MAYINKPKNNDLKIKDWLWWLGNGKVYLDLGFQSRKRWDKIDKQLFLYNFAQNIAPSKIVVCNIEDSLAKIDKNKYPVDHDYFYKLKMEGYVYVIIDGNNRDMCLLGFFESSDLECLLPETGKQIKGKPDVTKGYGPDNIRFKKDASFEKLDTYVDLQKHLLTREVTICEYIVTEVTHLGLIFDAIQRGKTLNDQERRNAWVVYDITEKIRNLTTKYEDILKDVVGKKASDRRGGDELLAKLHHYVIFENKHVNKTSLDYLYIYDATSKWNISKKYINRTFGILKKLGTSVKEINAANVMDLFDLVMFLDKSSIKIEKDFGEWWFGTLLKLKDRKLGDPLYFEKWYIGSKNINDPEIWTKDPDTGEYLIERWIYSESTREVGKSSGRPQRLQHWFELLMKDAETNDKLITTIDKQRLYTAGQTFTIWLRQDKKEVSGKNVGKEIPIANLFDTDLYQTDHTHEHSRGGPTTVENGEVMSVETHREKTKQMYKTISENAVKDETVSKLVTSTNVPTLL